MLSPTFKNLLLDEVETGIFQLTINRPKQLNAMNATTLDELAAAASWLREQVQIRVLLITGSGEKSFVAGADISEMQNKSALPGQQFGDKGQSTLRAIEQLPFPVIAVVNGYALGGGCELALSCDWILASDNARFGQPEVALGVIPGFGGTQRLARIVGRSRALELITTGRQLTADEALNWGLVNHIYPADALAGAAIEQARLVAKQAPLAVTSAKQVLHRGLDVDLDSGCLLELQAFGLCFSTDDQKEGMTAFVEKRQAAFLGK